MSGAVRSKDKGYRALLERVFGFGRPQIVMGILEKDGSAAKRTDRPTDGEITTLIEVAGWMEFGFTIERPDGTVIDVPARSFIRAWFDEAEPEMRAQLFALMRSVVAGKRSKDEILELLGQKGVGEIQARMAAGIDPPLAPSTIAAKGSSTPLIETGQLRSSVSYAVRERGR